MAGDYISEKGEVKMGYIVDLSHHQGNIDFSKASKEIDLAIIRVQYGSTTVDSMYREYVEGCKKYGIPFGHYAYARFVSANDAVVEAKDFLNRADKDAEFLVVDVEEVTTKNAGDMREATQAYINYLKDHTDKPVGLYTGHHFYKPYSMDKVTADFLWIPRYGGDKPDYACDLWQYTDKGKVSGISGYVDLNKINGAKALEYFTGKVEAKKVSKPVAKAKATTYKVAAGDNLTKISKKFGVSVANLKKYNGLKSDLILVGQVLSLVPSSTAKSKTTSKDTAIKSVGEIKIVNVKDACYIVDKPSQNSKNLDTAKKGSTLPISGSVTGWWEVIYKGKRAYVNAKYGQKI